MGDEHGRAANGGGFGVRRGCLLAARRPPVPAAPTVGSTTASTATSAEPDANADSVVDGAVTPYLLLVVDVNAQVKTHAVAVV